MSSFLTGLVAGFAIAMPPGAVTSLIVRIGLQRGFRSALALMSGSLHGRLGPIARGALAVVANGVVIALGVRILAQVVAV